MGLPSTRLCLHFCVVAVFNAVLAPEMSEEEGEFVLDVGGVQGRGQGQGDVSHCPVVEGQGDVSHCPVI